MTLLHLKYTRPIGTNNACELFERADNVTAAIGLEIFSLDSIDSSHPLLKAE